MQNYVLVVSVSTKVFTSSGKWMSFLLKQHLLTLRKKRIFWSAHPAALATTHYLFQGLFCFIVGGVGFGIFFGWFWFCFSGFCWTQVVFVFFLCHFLNGLLCIHLCWFVFICSKPKIFSLLHGDTGVKANRLPRWHASSYCLYPWIAVLDMRGRKISGNLFYTHKQLQTRSLLSSVLLPNSVMSWGWRDAVSPCALKPLAMTVHSFMPYPQREAGNFMNTPCPMP